MLGGAGEGLKGRSCPLPFSIPYGAGDVGGRSTRIDLYNRANEGMI